MTDFCDKNVKLALTRRKHQQDREKVEDDQRFEERMCLLDEMAKETQDPIDLRYQILSVFSPAHDGASIALSNVFFHLARNPSIWSQLRTEILPTKHSPLTYPLLKSYKFLDYVLRESSPPYL